MRKSSAKSPLRYEEHLFGFSEKVASAGTEYLNKKLPEKIWEHDHRVWKDNPEEITNRLGWLSCADEMLGNVEDISGFALEIKSEGFEDVVVIGMGGSSLSCDVFSRVFDRDRNYPELRVLDSTHPETIRRIMDSIKPEKTLIIVSTKSGTTVETISLLRFFYRKFSGVLGPGTAGKHFVAITDPGTSLEDTAHDLGFRRIFINNPDIGGRYSALSNYGLVPAALKGINLGVLLDKAVSLQNSSHASDLSNLPFRLGIALGVLAENGINRMCIVTSEKLYPLVDWLEQLIAESTGKEGKGILPVFEKRFEPGFEYGHNAFFVFIDMNGDSYLNENMQSVLSAGYPLVKITLGDPYDIAGEFFRWEFAVSVSGAVMGINPFDQPDVEETKRETVKLIDQYMKNGYLDEPDYDMTYPGMQIALSINNGETDLAVWIAKLTETSDERYICLQVYLDHSEVIITKIETLRRKLKDRFGKPVTAGFGPRYLHSTGQLHKGDKGKGIFIQITSDIKNDLPVPDSFIGDSFSFTFGILNSAQAYGDYKALAAKSRSVARVHLSGDPPDGIDALSGIF